MNRVILIITTLFSVGVLSAQTLADGFYRVQNKTTGRYMKVRDSYGELNYKTTQPDLTAIITLNTFEESSYDPGTVLYISRVGEQYNIESQGTDIYSVIGYYIRLRSVGNNLWQAYQTKSGTTVYLMDEVWSNGKVYEYGYVLTTGSARDWYITPISASSDNYVCVKPTMQVGDKYYASYYASYSFDLVSEGMKAYYVDKINNSSVHLTEIEGTIPKGTSVIIECSSADSEENKIEPTSVSPVSLSDNLLKGSYFNIAEGKKHTQQIAYDKSTMRLLGITENGTLGYVTGDIDYIPENTGYLVVSEDCNAEMPIVDELIDSETPETPNDPEIDNAVDGVQVDTEVNKIYTIGGVLLNVKDKSTLTKGTYIVRGKKVIVK